MSKFADKAKSIQVKKGKHKVVPVMHEQTGEVAGVHLVHDDGHQDAIVGASGADPAYLEYLAHKPEET